MYRSIGFAFAITLLASVSGTAGAQKRYHLIAFNVYNAPIPIASAADNALSGNGFLAGSSYFADAAHPTNQYPHALIWTNQVSTLLGTFGVSLANTNYGLAATVNRLGQAVGYSQVLDALHQDKGFGAFLWSNGIFTRLPDLGHDATGKVSTFANFINDSGDVVGSSDTYDSRFNDNGPTAFLYRNRTSVPIVDFGTNGAGNHSSSATGINNVGQICGNALAYDANHKDLGAIAFLYENGTATTLPSPGVDGSGRSQNYAVAINDSGLVAGDAVVYNPVSFNQDTIAVIWHGGTLMRLPDLDTKPNGDTFSQVTGMNRSGDVVGNSFRTNFAADTYPENFDNASVLWHGGAIHDLNTLLISGVKTAISHASGISDGGRISTYAVIDGFQTDALLIPVAGGDFDNDGFADLLWQNTTTGDVTIGFSDGNTYRGTASLASAVPADWQIVATPDLNGDGHSDVLWRNTTNGDLAYWLTDGQTLIDSRLLTSAVPLNWRVVGSGDFVGDGYTDLIFQNQTTGDLAYWQMQGTAFVASRPLTTSSPGPNWQVAGVADLNGDGGLDLLFRNTQTGDVGYWLLHGDTIADAGVIVPGVTLDWQLKGVGDLNGNGSVALLWQNTTTGDAYAWTLEGTRLINTRLLAPAVPAQWHLVGPK